MEQQVEWSSADLDRPQLPAVASVHVYSWYFGSGPRLKVQQLHGTVLLKRRSPRMQTHLNPIPVSPLLVFCELTQVIWQSPNSAGEGCISCQLYGYGNRVEM